MIETTRWIAILLCVAILATQLWRAKRMNADNTVARYHCMAGLLTLAVSLECALLVTKADNVYWAELLLLTYLLIRQVVEGKDWQHGVPEKWQSHPAPLSEN